MSWHNGGKRICGGKTTTAQGVYFTSSSLAFNKIKIVSLFVKGKRDLMQCNGSVIAKLQRGGMFWEIHPHRTERFPEAGNFKPRLREILRSEGQVFSNTYFLGFH